MTKNLRAKLDSIDLALYEVAADLHDLKNRLKDPDGQFDRAGRFYLSRRYRCCNGIRNPSRDYPFSQLTHARSAVHVAHEHGFAGRETEIRRFAKLMESYPELRQLPEALLAMRARLAASECLEEITRG